MSKRASNIRFLPYITVSLLLLAVIFVWVRTLANDGNIETAFTSQSAQGLVTIESGDDIQTLIDQHPENTTFYLRAGIYRLQSLEPKNGNIFIGETGTVLNGARTLTDFQQGDGYWVVTGQTQQMSPNGNCRDGYERCMYAEDLYFDNVPLRHVASLDELESGTWYFDYSADSIYIFDDPQGHLVETSLLEYAFGGFAERVTIRNIVIEKYATPAQTGAIEGDNTRNWSIEEVTVRLNHGTGIRIGDGMRILNSRVLNNGQLGIGGLGDDVLIEGNEIAFNNYAQFASNWEAGGAKFVSTARLVIRNNYVHHNEGSGLWTDIDNIDTLYEDNLVILNQHSGIFHEISYDAIIRNNTVQFNSIGEQPWLSGAQIQISNSQNVEVYGNQVIISTQGGNGITITQEDRGGGEYGLWVSYNNYIHDNTIVHLGTEGLNGVATNWDDSNFWQNANNHFDNNLYYVFDMDNTYWHWNDQRQSWGNLQGIGQEANGTISTEFPEGIEQIPTWSHNR